MQIKNKQVGGQIEAWVQSLDADDASIRGWGPQKLYEALSIHPFVFLKGESGQMTSCVVFQALAPDLCEILFLGTSKNFQGKGLMTQLLGEFVAKGPFARVWLECRADNHRAQHLYRTLGFVENSQRKNYYKDGTPAILFAFFRNN